MTGSAHQLHLNKVTSEEPQIVPTHNDMSVATAEPDVNRTETVVSIPETEQKGLNQATREASLLNLETAALYTLQKENPSAYGIMKKDIACGNDLVEKDIDAKVFNASSRAFFNKDYENLSSDQKTLVQKHNGEPTYDYMTILALCFELVSEIHYGIEKIRAAYTTQNRKLRTVSFSVKLDSGKESDEWDPAQQLLYLVRIQRQPSQNLFDRPLPPIPDFSEQLQITILDLIDLRLSSLPYAITKLMHLDRLHLEDNNFAIFPTEILALENLCVLDLSRNKLTTIPPEIENLKKLTVLHLSQNNLTSLPPEIENLEKLTMLSIENNDQLVWTPPLNLLRRIVNKDVCLLCDKTRYQDIQKLFRETFPH